MEVLNQIHSVYLVSLFIQVLICQLEKPLTLVHKKSGSENTAALIKDLLNYLRVTATVNTSDSSP